MLDHSEGVLNPWPGTVALLVEGLVRTVELSFSRCLALPPLVHVSLVAADHLLLTICKHASIRVHSQALRTHYPPNLAYRSRYVLSFRNTTWCHSSSTSSRDHAASLRFSLVTAPRRWSHPRSSPPLKQATLSQYSPTQLKQPPRQPVPLQYMAKLAEGRLVRRLANVHTGGNALRQVIAQRILHSPIRYTHYYVSPLSAIAERIRQFPEFCYI